MKNFKLLNIIYYYFVVLFIILCVLALVCATYFIIFNKRFPINEVEDYDWFNQTFTDVANGMLYDMGYSQLYQTNTLPPQFTQLVVPTNNEYAFLDIGSGGGQATVHHLRQFFGQDIKIILSYTG